MSLYGAILQFAAVRSIHPVPILNFKMKAAEISDLVQIFLIIYVINNIIYSHNTQCQGHGIIKNLNQWKVIYYYRVLRAICCQPIDGSLIWFM